VHPQQDAKEAQDALLKHLNAVRPFGISLTVTPGATGDGFAAETSGPAYDAARAALATSVGRRHDQVATGGSIPLVHALSTGVPDAEILLLGATDGFSNIHAPKRARAREENFATPCWPRHCSFMSTPTAGSSESLPREEAHAAYPPSRWRRRVNSRA
jgi:hypothetical protein